MVEGKIGEHGSYSANIDNKGIMKAAVEVEIDVIVELEKLAARTDNSLDDKLVSMVKAALGR